MHELSEKDVSVVSGAIDINGDYFGAAAAGGALGGIAATGTLAGAAAGSTLALAAGSAFAIGYSLGTAAGLGGVGRSFGVWLHGVTRRKG